MTATLSVPVRIKNRVRWIFTNRSDIKTLEQDVQALQGEVVGWMEEHDATEVVVGDLKATLVASTSVSVNADQLQARLTEEQWAAVTVRTLDKKKLERAVASGLIDPVTVAQASEVSSRKPYVRVTPYKKEA